MTIRAAGTLLATSDGRALFLRRDDGTWAFPGGQIEDGETAEEAAERETREEIGAAPYSELRPLMRRVKDKVDFTTFIARVKDEFVPNLDGEHTGWSWASVAEPPEPLHPGARVALDRLNMDELGIAKAMAAGDLTSPQRYGNLWLFAIRITGTGLAYRLGRDEFAWRDPDLYLTDEFLQRCNGLPVIWEHPPDKPALDSKEFDKRTIGTTFLPYIQGDEVWAIVKIYDSGAASLMMDEQLSTSPAVVFNDASGNETLKLEDGKTLLIEGKPALLDHIAVCDVGVWDKGLEPKGVRNDSLNPSEPQHMSEERKDQAEEARNDVLAKLDAIADALARTHARMDAMERKDAEEAERRKKEEEERKDAARKDGAACDERKDASEKEEERKDASEEEEEKEEEKEERKDASEEKEEEREERKDAARKDAERKDSERKDAARKDGEDEPKEEKEEPVKDTARHDAQTIADLQKRLKAAEAALRVINTPMSDVERAALAAAQARADSIAGMFGKRASAPIPGEDALSYRRRVANEFKQFSPKFKNKSLAGFDSDVLEFAEDQIYADAAAAAKSPERAGAGILIPITETDMAGRRITKWTGDNMAWMQHFMTGAQIGRFRDPRDRSV